MRALLDLAGPDNTWTPYKWYDTVQLAVAAAHKLSRGGFKVRMHYGKDGLAHFSTPQAQAHKHTA